MHRLRSEPATQQFGSIPQGLTAIDTATEVQAYYVAQVEKILTRYEQLVRERGAEPVRAQLLGESGLEREEAEALLAELLAHGEAVRRERERAQRVGESPGFLPLLRAWGGVTVLYRRGMNESPAYLRNHEEIGSALREGIFYAEGIEPLRVELDRFGHVRSLVCRRLSRVEGDRWLGSDEEVELPARAILVAAGAIPNTLYAREHPGSLTMEESHYVPHVSHARGVQPVAVAPHCKSPEFGAFTSFDAEGRRVSFLGDTHPVFHGSVVKAIASAARSWPEVMRALSLRRPSTAEIETPAFRAAMQDLFVPRVESVRRDSPNVIELLVRAPLAARRFRPGQFFRLQSFETLSPVVEGTRLQIEPMAVSGAGVAGDSLRLMVVEAGASSRLCALLRPGTPVVLMGPTGVATPIPQGRTVLVAAGRRGAAVMLTLGPALRAAGNRVLYFAGFNRSEELYRRQELESAADVVVWCTAHGDPIPSQRPQDHSATGAFVEVMRRYADGDLGSRIIDMRDVDRVLAIGTERLLRMMRDALAPGGALAGRLGPELEATGSVGSPMQCMMKGVCAQCLQWQVDPETGRRTRAVFSCAEQDQPLAWIDLDNLAARLAQNRLQEHLGDAWLTWLLGRADLERV